MKTLRTLLFCLAGAAAPVAAADFPSTPPPPGPAPDIRIPQAVETVLPNGLRLVTVARPGLPLVSVRLLVPAGAERDPADRAGLTSLSNTLMAKGADGRSAAQVAEAAEALGGRLNVTTGWDASSLGITVATPVLDPALALLAGAALRPDHAQEELERTRLQGLSALQQGLSRPGTVSALALAREVFGAHRYGHPAAGTPASLPRIGRDDVVRQHRSLWRPDHAVLLFAGQITPEQARALASRHFGAWAIPPEPLPAPLPTPAPGRGGMLLVHMPDAGQASVAMGVATPPRRDPDHHVGVLANAILGGSYSARLGQEIRIKRGLSYSASSNLQARRHGGIWSASAQTKNASALEVAELMRSEAARLGSAPVPAEEFAARKATLTGNYAMDLESTGGLAVLLGELAVHGIALDEANRFIQRVDAVSPAQVQAYAARHLAPESLRLVVAGDTAELGAPIPSAVRRKEAAEFAQDAPAPAAAD